MLPSITTGRSLVGGPEGQAKPQIYHLLNQPGQLVQNISVDRPTSSIRSPVPERYHGRVARVGTGGLWPPEEGVRLSASGRLKRESA